MKLCLAGWVRGRAGVGTCNKPDGPFSFGSQPRHFSFPSIECRQLSNLGGAKKKQKQKTRDNSNSVHLLSPVRISWGHCNKLSQARWLKINVFCHIASGQKSEIQMFTGLWFLQRS